MDEIFDLEGSASMPEPLSPEREKLLDEILSRRVGPEEHARLERLLIQRLKENRSRLQEMLERMSDDRGYEDAFYRFYHGSFKVYAVQQTTEKAAALLRSLMPERKLNLSFETILRDGTGKEFQMDHNREWHRHTRPILEAFAHAKYMIEMALRYAGLDEPPHPLPFGWAALLYLCDLR